VILKDEIDDTMSIKNDEYKKMTSKKNMMSIKKMTYEKYDDEYKKNNDYKKTKKKKNLYERRKQNNIFAGLPKLVTSCNRLFIKIAENKKVIS
jgi:hypothetical protein